MERIYRTTPTAFSLNADGHIINYKVKKTLIRNELLRMSNDHCSYCNSFFADLSNEDTDIEHFKPKDSFPDENRKWTNLFVTCRGCNRIKSKYYPTNFEPLKPDTDEYDFDKWYEIDPKTDEIIPNKSLSDFDKMRADKTANEFLKLNRPGKVVARKREFELHKNATDLTRVGYPFFIRRKILLNKKAESLDFLRKY